MFFRTEPDVSFTRVNVFVNYAAYISPQKYILCNTIPNGLLHLVKQHEFYFTLFTIKVLFAFVFYTKLNVFIVDGLMLFLDVLHAKKSECFRDIECFTQSDSIVVMILNEGRDEEVKF